jgi:hypothetical protein
VEGPHGAVTIELSERLATLTPIVAIPLGITVKVEREGYKPWLAIYNSFEFVTDQQGTFRRLDVL